VENNISKGHNETESHARMSLTRTREENKIKPTRLLVLPSISII
jgi:hypothetical protein